MLRLAVVLCFACFCIAAATEPGSEVSPISLKGKHKHKGKGERKGKGNGKEADKGKGKGKANDAQDKDLGEGTDEGQPEEAPASGSAGCPWAFNTGSVGSCMVFGCSASRGPTHCSSGGCFCNDGFCRYPASTVHVQSRYCVQRVPDSTCHATRVCYKGGLSTTFCEKGLCMCKWGYRLTSDGTCGSTSGFSLADLGNATTEDLEILREQDNLIKYNVAMFALWVTGFTTMLAAGAAFAFRKFRVHEEADSVYVPFLECE